MSKIDEMIKELCPEGVDVQPLGAVCDILRGKRVTKSDIKPQGTYPVISGGITPMGYMEDFNREPNTITVSQYGTAGYVDFQRMRFWANDICYCLYPKSNLNNKYLWYVLKDKQNYLYEIRNTDATPFSLPSDTLKGVEIPLPPLPIQQEIVSVLDSFTTLIDKMKQELEKRKKQMEYYREKLLTFEDGECALSHYIFHPKERIDASELDKDNYVSVENLLKDKAGKIISESVPTEGNWIKYEIGDILIGNIRPYLKKIWLADRSGGTNGDVIVLRKILNSNADYRFIYYILSSDKFFNFYNNTAKGGKMPRGDKKKLLEYSVHIPSLDKQREIVSILDKFESYITKLEKMIALRQKQYEYYREQLLTFE